MKSNLDQFFKTSADLEKNGVEFEIAPGVSFMLRPFKSTNPRVKAAMATLYKPYARQIELDTLGIEKQRDIQMKLFIQVCLAGWTGVEIDGTPVECTPDNALRLFTELPDLFDTLQKHSNDFNNYKEDLGNS